MINYLKSENYRLLRKKSPYITSIICYLLIIALAFILYNMEQQSSIFALANTTFFYSNVIAGGTLIIIIGLIFNLILTGKDTSLIKQSISFGISRNTIFWSKLILTLSYFLLVCVIGVVLTITIGESLLASQEQSVSNFLVAGFNMVPIVVSGFVIIHVLKMLNVGDIYIVMLLLFVYVFSGNLLYMLFDYTPSTLLNENLTNFMNYSAQFDYRHWITGIVVSVIVLLIGMKKFAKQNID